MKKSKKPSGLKELDSSVEELNPELDVIDLFNHLRCGYLKRKLTPAVRKRVEAIEIEYPQASLDEKTQREFSRMAEQFGLNWDDIGFHLRYRVKNLEDLLSVDSFTPEERAGIERALRQGYDVSILPLNLVLPREVRTKYMPVADYFDKHPTGNPDPYGLFTDESVIRDDRGDYVASRKFPHTALVNITDYCPIGCVGCYKSAIGTREKRKVIDLDIGKHRVLEQTINLVDYLNVKPEVYDIILSGGEPLMYPNEEIERILDILRNAKHLSIVRICTGTLFQGLPFRVDDELLYIFKRFSNETGKRITFNAHLSNHYQITPEALIAVNKIRRRGFNIYSQVPIQEGVNFFRGNEEKTEQFWSEMGRREAAIGVQPYKFIVDMHPRTVQRYVPIEEMMKIWSRVYDTHEHPELERPTSMGILCNEGNVLLSGHTLMAARKEVDKERGTVTYRFPAEFSGDQYNEKIGRTYTYKEPLIEGCNDNPRSLENLRKEFFIK